MVTREDISSLPVPDAKFQEAKSDYLEQLIVTPEMVAKEKERKGTFKMVAVEQISTPLARVFNLSLKERVEWKKANII